MLTHRGSAVRRAPAPALVHATLTRRHFLLVSVGAVSSLAVGERTSPLRAPGGAGVLRIGTTMDVPSDVRSGLSFGFDEARQSARLIGWRVEAVDLADTVSEVDAVILAAGAHSPRADVPVVRLACVADSSTAAANEVTLHPRAATIVRALEASLEPGRLRDGGVLLLTEDGQRWLGHSWTSPARPVMVADARCEIGATPFADTVPMRRVELWHPSLDRFGAEQLRARYRAYAGTEMTSRAWLAWFGVKLLWETAARAKSAQPAALLAYLRSFAARYDGHKGVALGFNTNSELEQPLYVVEKVPGDAEWKLVAEIPTDAVRVPQ